MFVEWIRRSLHGISPQITHFKVQTEYPISDTEIESFLEALGTTPLEVLSIQGALHVDLSLFNWIANHFPNLRGLTLVRRESTRSRYTKPIIWPLPTWVYARCLSAFPKLEYFGWNNGKRTEQYTTYSLLYLEDPSLANDHHEISEAHTNERFFLRDDNTPILFGAFCPNLRTLALSYSAYRISRPVEGITIREDEVRDSFRGEYEFDMFFDGHWPHRLRGK